MNVGCYKLASRLIQMNSSLVNGRKERAVRRVGERDNRSSEGSVRDFRSRLDKKRGKTGMLGTSGIAGVR